MNQASSTQSRRFPIRGRVALPILAIAAVSAAVVASSTPDSNPEPGESPVRSTRQASGPTSATELERWKNNLEFLTRGESVWWSSNARYLEEDGGTDAYLIAYRIRPGALSADGCLWGERAGETLGPFWDFFMGWDPEAGQGLVYQSSPAGAVGSGYWTPGADASASHADQTFLWPDGSVERVRHVSRTPGASTQVDSSFNRVGGEWVARRTYTWERRPAGSLPCR